MEYQYERTRDRKAPRFALLEAPAEKLLFED